MPSHAMYRLRRQADMAHHRDVDFRDSPHRFRDRDTAFELHRFGAAFLYQAAGVAERFLGTDLIREEWHIGDDQRAPAGPHNGASMIDDFVDGDGERAVLAANHHREAVADQERIDAATVEDPGEWKVVRGQHRDWLM